MASKKRTLSRQGGPYYRPSEAAPARMPEASNYYSMGASPFAQVAPFGPLGRGLSVYYPPYGPRRVVGSQRLYSSWDTLQIRVPRKAVFCVRRKSRREVLFALRRAGFRGSAPKRHYRRSQDSLWRC